MASIASGSGRAGRRAGRRLDVVVYGATGFTGKLIAEYFASLGPLRREACRRPIRWGIAGRSEAKLLALRRAVVGLSSGDGGGGGGDYDGEADQPEVLVADATDAASLDAMTSKTTVLLSAAGPYLDHGSNVVSSCVRNGTDYVDITGETPFVRRSIDSHHERAIESGAYVYHMCGYDSVPSDLGTYRAVMRVRELWGEQTRRVATYVTSRGQLSGGTIESGMRMDSDESLTKMVDDPFLLGGNPSGPGNPCRPDDLDRVEHERLGGGVDDGHSFWTAPFPMAKLNTRVVRRSAFEIGYGPDFVYDEMMIVPDEKTARKLARPPAPVSKRLQLRDAGRLPKQGEGPSPEERAKNWFKFIVVAEGTSTGRKVVTSVSGGDPGYTETAKMASEAALTLVEDRDDTLAAKVGRTGGVLTTAWMGDALLRRLKAAGILFEDEGTLQEGEDEARAVVAAAKRRGLENGRSKL